MPVGAYKRLLRYYKGQLADCKIRLQVRCDKLTNLAHERDELVELVGLYRHFVIPHLPKWLAWGGSEMARKFQDVDNKLKQAIGRKP